MKTVLITGGTGSFGTAFVKFLLKQQSVNKIVVFSRGEHRQAEMRDEINDPDSKLRFFIGDVRDRDRLRRAFNGIDLVVHAAALKRIEVGQYNPIEMVKTNVEGTSNVVEAAMDKKVKCVVGISSDKAYQPVSPYGLSKALAEAIMLNANNMRSSDEPEFKVVRYGNVAGSAGSVIPRWRNILKTSIVVPVTDPDCTRFWMTMEQAVELVWETATHEIERDKVRVPSLPAYRLGDLAYVMGARKFNVLGLPHWEKLHESMDEKQCSKDAPRLTIEQLNALLKEVA